MVQVNRNPLMSEVRGQQHDYSPTLLAKRPVRSTPKRPASSSATGAPALFPPGVNGASLKTKFRQETGRGDLANCVTLSAFAAAPPSLYSRAIQSLGNNVYRVTLPGGSTTINANDPSQLFSFYNRNMLPRVNGSVALYPAILSSAVYKKLKDRATTSNQQNWRAVMQFVYGNVKSVESFEDRLSGNRITPQYINSLVSQGNAVVIGTHAANGSGKALNVASHAYAVLPSADSKSIKAFNTYTGQVEQVDAGTLARRTAFIVYSRTQ